MARPQDTLASTISLAENSENLMGGLGSKVKDNAARSSDVKNVGHGFPAAAVSERVVENETVLESLEKDKIQDGNFNSLSNGETSPSDNGTNVRVGVVGRAGKFKDNKGSCLGNGESSGNGESEGDGCKKLDASGMKGLGKGEKLEESDHRFCVGDIVWSKIKSHPWWPGQIYDAKDASEFAVKYSQEGRLLVAFFGDGSCSWCLPSQLIPFVENFKEMSTDGSSRSFHKAIQGAFDEVGRLVESDMTCNCVPLEKRDGLARPVVENAGLKPGVLAPEVDIRRLSIPKYEPAEILSKVMHFAKGDSVDSALELAVLKSSLSAFYRAKGGYRLPEYHDPVYIEGLEDKNKDESAVANDFSIPIEFPIVGPKEAEWPSPYTDAIERPSDSSNVKIYHRRKQKSVAELMAANTDIKLKNQKRATVKESKDAGKSSSSLKKKKRYHGEVEEGDSEGASRKRKVVVSVPTKMTNEKVSDAENSGDGDVDEKQKTIEVPTAENTSGKADIVSTPRERKKSKYLSPPYTDPRWKMGSSSAEIESKPVKITKTDDVGEQMTMASEDLHGSPPLSKNVVEAPDDKLTIRQLKVLEKTSVDATSLIVENDKKMSFSASDVDVPINELLLEIQIAAVSPLYLSNEGSLDTVRAFVSALRSSTYLHGPDYQIFQKCKRSRKRKSTPSRLQDEENESKSAHKQKTPKAEKSVEKPDTSRSKKASEIPLEQKKSEGNTSSCLILAFTPEYPLPSKEEVIKLFGKFGRLNEKETSVIMDSHAVQIAYMKDSDAEAAFKSSINESPFGIENVKYWLQHGSKPRGALLPPIMWGLEKTKYSDDYMTDVRMIRQKIEIMTAIVENYHSKFSAEDKTSLKDEMKHLMDSVEMASEKVRVMAEKTSASS